MPCSLCNKEFEQALCKYKESLADLKNRFLPVLSRAHRLLQNRRVLASRKLAQRRVFAPVVKLLPR